MRYDDDIILLLEAGPAPLGQLAEWLRLPAADVRAELQTLAAEGRIRIKGRNWMLLAQPIPPADLSPASPTGPATPATEADSTSPRHRPPSSSRPVVPPLADDIGDAAKDLPLVESVRLPRRDPLEGYEVVWTPHRDAPSLTASVEGLGASLSGIAFGVVNRRASRSGAL